MKKQSLFKKIVSLTLGLFLVCTLTFKINSANVTDNVTLVGEKQYESLWDGVELERMHVQSKLHGVPTNGNTYNWDAVSITAQNNPAIRIVTWGLTSANGVGYKAGTTMDIAKNYEKENPGYTVIAAINGDFSQMRHLLHLLVFQIVKVHLNQLILGLLMVVKFTSL